VPNVCQGNPPVYTVHGCNTAGGAYIVYLASESIMIEKMAYAFLAGPPMVKSAIGETVSPEDLGGAYVHTQHSGGCDHIVKTQEEGIAKIRAMMEFEPSISFSSNVGNKRT